MAGAFPVSVTVYTNPTGTSHVDVPVGGRTLDQFIADLCDDAEAVQTKLGIGTSTPASNTVLRGSSGGASAYGQVQPGDLATMPAARVSNNAIQSIPNNATTAALMQVESEDTGNFHSTITNTSRIVLGVAGLWLVVGTGTLNANGAATTAYRILGIRVDGAGLILGNGIFQSTGSDSDHDASLLVRSSGTTYAELAAYQSSGVATNLASGAALQAVWLGP